MGIRDHFTGRTHVLALAIHLNKWKGSKESEDRRKKQKQTYELLWFKDYSSKFKLILKQKVVIVFETFTYYLNIKTIARKSLETEQVQNQLIVILCMFTSSQQPRTSTKSIVSMRKTTHCNNFETDRNALILDLEL